MAAYSIQNVDIECELCKRLFPGFTKFAGHPCVSNGMFIRHIYPKSSSSQKNENGELLVLSIRAIKQPPDDLTLIKGSNSKPVFE
jgi:hypothetical protein